MEVSAASAMPWPKKHRVPVRLTPEEAQYLIEGEVNQSFHARVRDYVLRLVWTVRRLENDNHELRMRLREPEQ